MSDNRTISYLDKLPESDSQFVWTLNIDTQERTPLITPDKLLRLQKTLKRKTSHPYAISGYQWSPDEKYILFCNIPSRRSSAGNTELDIFDVAKSTLKRITVLKGEHRNVKWSPDSKSIGYVVNSDIYIQKINSSEITQITNTGTETRYNGRFGWVYEEELASVDGWQWSPDGKQIAYMQIDESSVPVADIPNYDSKNMTSIHMRYPKAGDPNPTARVGIVSLKSSSGVPQTKWVKIDRNDDDYLAQMQWNPNGELLILQIPRLQNTMNLYQVNPKNCTGKLIFTQTDDAWLVNPGPVTFTGKDGSFLWTEYKDDFAHIFLYEPGKKPKPITSGNWEVERILGYSESDRTVYFSAGYPTPMDRQILSVSIDTGIIEHITTTSGSHTAYFNGSFSHYLHTFHNITTAPTLTIESMDDAEQILLISNPMPLLKNYEVPKWEFIEIPISKTLKLNAMILKPMDFDPGKKYPVLMHTYGGPGSQVVRNSWMGGGFDQVLAANGVITVRVDGRGSGMRGSKFEKCTYLNLTKFETDDQIAAAKWLKKQPWVKSENVGIWGWSYGGHMASICILKGCDTFRCAISVAPVTHWELYDSIYTERYMRTPKDNPEGYASTNAIAMAERLKGRYLIIHGTADDNVHVINTLRLVAEFQRLNKPFEMMLYPGKHHGIQDTHPHLFAQMLRFIQEALIN